MTFSPRTWNAGETVDDGMMNEEIRDQFNEMFAAWTSYTPTWTSSGTAPSLGNGTLTGRYLKLGRTVQLHVNLIMGSTTTYGTGSYSFALPFTSANAGCSYIGHAHLLAGSSRWGGQVVISPNATVCGPFMSTSNANPTLAALTGTSPSTLAANHAVRITVVYESAA